MRRLRALIAGLPRECALYRKLAPQHVAWTTTTELLAGLVEAVDLGNRMFLMANTKAGTKVPDPIVIRRPGSNRSSPNAEADKPKLTRAAMRAMLLGG